MGRAAASIAVSSLRPHMTFDGEAQLQDTAKQGQELCRRAPWLSGAVHHLLEELAAIHTSVYTVGGPRPLAPIHGAPHAHQWLEADGQLGLVDFDGFTLGERELDIATFWSEIDFERRSKVHGVEVNRAFLAGYEAVAGGVDRRLLKAYCAHKRLSKALKYAYAVHPEGDVRAEQTLGRALVSVLSCAEE
jgi:thiamine kinase-like enzyme